MGTRKPKLWYRSRIVWLQGAFGILTGAAMFLPAIQHMLSPLHWFLLATIVNGATVVLRFVTTDPITLRNVRNDEYEVG